MGLTVEQAFNAIAKERKFLEDKVAESIKFKVRKVIPRHQVEDLVSDAMTLAIGRLSEGKVAFESEAKLIGYLLYSCWFNYRDANKKTSIKKAANEDWELESLQLMGTDNSKFFSLDNPANIFPDFEDEETEETTAQDKSDNYYAELYEKVFLFLEDCVLRNEFSFRDANLFKMYLVNGYTGAIQLAEASDFNLHICRNAIKKIKKRLRETDFSQID